LKRLPCLLLFTILAIAVALPATAQKNSNEITSVPFSQAPYRVGEKLTYNVTFANFINAAHVELFVAGRGIFYNHEGIELKGHVETTGIVSAALVALNNDYTSYVDPRSGQPYRAQQVVRQGGRSSDSSVDYNVALGADAIPPKRIGAFPGTFDFLSALYRVRALPLTEGATYYFTAQGNSTQYDVELRVLGRETVKTNVGSFNAIVAQIRTPHNSKADDLKTKIFFSDDERHVPVLITAKLNAGQLRIDLASSEFIDPDTAPAPSGQIAADPVAPAVMPGSAAPLAADTVAHSPASDLPFDVGEQLNYNVFLGSQTQQVATAFFEVKSRAKFFNKDGLLLAVNARTNGPVARLFTASDTITSYVDPTTLLPFRTELQLAEGKRRVAEVMLVDQDRGTAVTDKGRRIEIPVGTHDVLSVLYAMRSFNLAPPRRNAVSLMVNNRPLTLFITSLRHETIQVNGRSIRAIQLSLTTDDPQPDKFGLRVWIGEDRRRIPLRVTANTEIGPVRADLAIIPVDAQ
jgi:hypothetical protein